MNIKTKIEMRTHAIEYWNDEKIRGERFYSRTFAEGNQDLANQINSILSRKSYNFRIWDYPTYKKIHNIP